MDKILEDLGLDLLVNVTPSALVGMTFFIDKDLSKENAYTVEKSDLKALFVYYEDGDKLKVKVYRQQNGSVTEVAELASEVTALSYNDAESFSSILFEKGTAELSSIFIAENGKTGDRKGIDQFSKRIERYSGIKTSARPTGGFDHMEHYGEGVCENLIRRMVNSAVAGVVTGDR